MIKMKRIKIMIFSHNHDNPESRRYRYRYLRCKIAKINCSTELNELRVSDGLGGLWVSELPKDLGRGKGLPAKMVQLHGS